MHANIISGCFKGPRCSKLKMCRHMLKFARAMLPREVWEVAGTEFDISSIVNLVPYHCKITPPVVYYVTK